MSTKAQINILPVTECISFGFGQPSLQINCLFFYDSKHWTTARCTPCQYRRPNLMTIFSWKYQMCTFSETRWKGSLAIDHETGSNCMFAIKEPHSVKQGQKQLIWSYILADQLPWKYWSNSRKNPIPNNHKISSAFGATVQSITFSRINRYNQPTMEMQCN